MDKLRALHDSPRRPDAGQTSRPVDNVRHLRHRKGQRRWFVSPLQLSLLDFLCAYISTRPVCLSARITQKTIAPLFFTWVYAWLDSPLKWSRSGINTVLTISGRCSGPPRCDTWIRHFARPTFVTSSFKIFLTRTFPPCGATCYTLPSRTMTQLFNGVDFVYHSVEVCRTFCSYLRVVVTIRNVYNGGRQ